MGAETQDSKVETISRTRPVRDLDCALLRTFLAVIDTGTLQQASNQVCRTQAAVSQQIKRLEDIIGVALFEKTGRKLELTAYGRNFSRGARIAMDRHDRLLIEAAGNQSLVGWPQKEARISVTEADLRQGHLVAITRSKENPNHVETVCAVRTFKDNLSSDLQRRILEYWAERQSTEDSLSLDQLVCDGVLSRDRDLALLVDVSEGAARVVDMTSQELVDYGLRPDDLGQELGRYVDDVAIVKSRTRMYQTCVQAGVPAFFSGTALVPSWSHLINSNPEYLTMRNDRLLIPVVYERPSKLEPRGRRGVIIVATVNQGFTYNVTESEAHPGDASGHAMNVTSPPIFGF